ncbi:Signal transduction histidine-protein kinase BaeS [Cedecea davisae]|uniref:histidine kinase n=1 Tax=Cedecea davisae DSM 4568 TaxID=566551 RepID=S3JY89_9ENTR|nr:ATP-binding protein [Cedecea davisae]EPF18009.1 ATPase/histidine kinase/DNA gyrase B/HSP90 domain protein [Cedecea davisae DSM 4568]SUX28313.1 Signal transduction histidine-protein kinase BaeS [Cedecea davisae]
MKIKKHNSLLLWISARIIVVAVSVVFFIVLAMWSIYAVQYYWVVHRMSPALYAEFLTLRENPTLDLLRFHEIVDAGWGLEFSTPSLSSLNWGWLFIFITMATPFVILRCLRAARPLAAQFSSLTEVAEIVAQGSFERRAKLVNECPEEIVRFTHNFNKMISQLALYERELKAAHVAAAHELRSPLTAAMGRLQGMIDHVFPADQKQLNMVMTQLKSLGRLTDDLHFLSLASAGQLTLQMGVLNLESVLNERLAWLKPQLEAAGMSVSLEAEGEFYYVGDESRLGQVFNIIIENMLRYCARGDSMQICMSRSERGIELTFQDSGPGVAEDYLPHIFERFTRGERSRARDSGGSGLGLSIAKEICAAHHGRITASQPQEKGLLIAIGLPVWIPDN